MVLNETLLAQLILSYSMDCYGTSANAKALHVDVHIHVMSFQYRYFEI